MAKDKLELEIKALVKGVREVLDLQRASEGVEKQGRKQVKDPTTKMRKGAKQTSGAMTALKGAIAGLGVAKLGGDFIRANTSIEAFRRGLGAVVDDVSEQAQVIGFLAAETDQLGISLQVGRDSMLSFLAAGKDGVLPMEELERVWSRTTETLSLLGKGSADVEGAIQALTQMMSKGTVQSEELRGQLGERLPGAYNIAARAMGLTTMELGKQLELGNILAADLLPRFADELERSFGVGTNRVETFTARLQRLQNEWSALLVEMGDTGVFDALSDTLGGIVTLVREGKQPVADFFEAARTGSTVAIAEMDTFGGLIDIVLGKLQGNAQQVEDGMRRVANAQGAVNSKLADANDLTDEQVNKLRVAKQAYAEVLEATDDALVAGEAFFEVVNGSGAEAEVTLQGIVDRYTEAVSISVEGGASMAASLDLWKKRQEALNAASGTFFIEYADGSRQLAGNIRENIQNYQALEQAEKAAAAAAKARQDALIAAAERVGVKTRAELAKLAEQARKDFETIRLSSQFTADASAEAAQQYIEAWRAAHGGVMPALKDMTVAEGDLYLAILEVEKAERLKKKASEEAAAAGVEGAQEATQAQRDLQQAIDDANRSYTTGAALSTSASGGFSTSGTGINTGAYDRVAATGDAKAIAEFQAFLDSGRSFVTLARQLDATESAAEKAISGAERRAGGGSDSGAAAFASGGAGTTETVVVKRLVFGSSGKSVTGDTDDLIAELRRSSTVSVRG